MTEHGTDGLKIFLTIIALVFFVGMFVMVIALVGGSILSTDNVYTTSSIAQRTENDTAIAGTAYNLSVANLRSVACTGISIVNGSTNVAIPSGNYSASNCQITPAINTAFNNTQWNTTFNYTFSDTNDAFETVNDTVVAISAVPGNWFAIFITIGAVVAVLSMLVLAYFLMRRSGIIGA